MGLPSKRSCDFLFVARVGLYCIVCDFAFSSLFLLRSLRSVLIQLLNVIDTISKRWRSKKAFNTSPSQIISISKCIKYMFFSSFPSKRKNIPKKH